jgi:hypothetical protein
MLGKDLYQANIPESLLSNAFTNKARSHGNDLSNNRRAVFSYVPSRDGIRETHLEVP